MSELEMATIPELIEELEKRMASLVLVGLSDIGASKNTHGRMIAWRKGNPFELVGLAHTLMDIAQANLQDAMEPSGDDDAG